MRPMTVREALQIERAISRHPRPDRTQALRIMDALVEAHEADLACDEEGDGVVARIKRRRAAEDKLAALERGEEPQ